MPNGKVKRVRNTKVRRQFVVGIAVVWGGFKGTFCIVTAN